MRSLFTWTILIVILTYFITSPSLNFSSNTRAVYQLYCTGFPLKKFDECDDKSIATSITKFKVFPDQQTVVRLNARFVESLKDCTVFDLDNWRCGTIQIIDGDYLRWHSDTDENENDYFRQVPRFIYTYYNLKHFF